MMDHLGFILTAAVIIGLIFAAWRFGGIKAAMVMLAAVGLWAIYTRGRSDGKTTTTEKERADADRAIRTADAARNRAAVRDADPDRLRQSDGFRRD